MGGEGRWESRSSSLVKARTVQKAVAGTEAEDRSLARPPAIPLEQTQPQPAPPRATSGAPLYGVELLYRGAVL